MGVGVGVALAVSVSVPVPVSVVAVAVAAAAWGVEGIGIGRPMTECGGDFWQQASGAGELAVVVAVVEGQRAAGVGGMADGVESTAVELQSSCSRVGGHVSVTGGPKLANADGSSGGGARNQRQQAAALVRANARPPSPSRILARGWSPWPWSSRVEHLVQSLPPPATLH